MTKDYEGFSGEPDYTGQGMKAGFSGKSLWAYLDARLDGLTHSQAFEEARKFQGQGHK